MKIFFNHEFQGKKLNHGDEFYVVHKKDNEDLSK